jgi:hypothetical protein
MEGITILETAAFQLLIDAIKRSNELIAELTSTKNVDDKYLCVEEVTQYIGFGKTWLFERQEDIGYYQDGKDKRFKKTDIDAYMAKYFIKSKHH